jgi:hypothetical protein
VAPQRIDDRYGSAVDRRMSPPTGKQLGTTSQGRHVTRVSLGNRRAASVGAILLSGLLMVSMTGTAAEASTVPSSGQTSSSPGVVPINAKYAGKSYGQWSGLWWKWALSIPADKNPMLDTTGANCGQGQSGSVWFLAGTFFNTPAQVTRSCTVPAGKALFFPIQNAFDANDPGKHRTYQDVLGGARTGVAGATGTAKVDGKTIKDVPRYYAESPKFSFTLPTGNVFPPGTPLGPYDPAAAAGIHLLLTPLSPGKHTIEWTGTTGTSSVHVVYNVKVTR